MPGRGGQSGRRIVAIGRTARWAVLRTVQWRLSRSRRSIHASWPALRHLIIPSRHVAVSWTLLEGSVVRCRRLGSNISRSRRHTGWLEVEIQSRRMQLGSPAHIRGGFGHRGLPRFTVTARLDCRCKMHRGRRKASAAGAWLADSALACRHESDNVSDRKAICSAEIVPHQHNPDDPCSRCICSPAAWSILFNCIGRFLQPASLPKT